jgi:chaperonin GroEL (HSP60 family)
MALKRGIDKAVEVAVEEVKRLSKPVSGDMIAQVQQHFRQQRPGCYTMRRFAQGSRHFEAR